ncbi:MULTISPECIES: DUF4279 domain-containing protein [Rhodobacterales]|uniref:DUF4279 domain-containing protein n=1 Tax=Rhodobacterales TaxID=204455 RepID=UPI003299DA81
MSNSADTDREYAYFRATGSFDPIQLTNELGLEPSECWETGEEFEVRGNKHNRKSSCWKMDSGLLDTENLDSHINELLRKLRPKRDSILRASTLAKLQIVCVGFYYQSFSWEPNFEHQKEITTLGIGFWFDTYSFGDYHEEMVDLREQLGVRADVDTNVV